MTTKQIFQQSNNNRFLTLVGKEKFEFNPKLNPSFEEYQKPLFEVIFNFSKN